jgi:hypothetical protein
MNTLYLYGTEISVGDLKQFLRKIELTFNYIILEFYDRVIFEKFDLKFVTDEDVLNRVRAFSNEYELKCRRKGDKFVVALTAEKALNGRVAQEFDGEPIKETYAKREPEDGFPLWGEYLDQVEVNGKMRHRWFEKRIPHPQLYPVDDESSYIGLKIVDYYDDERRLIARHFIEPYAWKTKKEGK